MSQSRSSRSRAPSPFALDHAPPGVAAAEGDELAAQGRRLVAAGPGRAAEGEAQVGAAAEVGRRPLQAQAAAAEDRLAVARAEGFQVLQLAHQLGHVAGAQVVQAEVQVVALGHRAGVGLQAQGGQEGSRGRRRCPARAGSCPRPGRGRRGAAGAGAAVEDGLDVHVRHAARRAAGLVALDGDQDHRQLVLLHQARGADADDALVPGAGEPAPGPGRPARRRAAAMSMASSFSSRSCSLRRVLVRSASSARRGPRPGRGSAAAPGPPSPGRCGRRRSGAAPAGRRSRRW